MKSQGCLVSAGLIALALGVGAGCKKDEPPKPDPATQGSTAAVPPKVNTRNPAPNRGDPQAVKDYRLDVCYYGTLSLRQARDSYLASLGKDEPSEKKIPSFGTTAAAVPPAVPGRPPKPGAAPSASVSLPNGAEGRRPDFMRGMPYERNQRACSIAVSLKEPAMGDVDGAVAAYAPFVAELSKDIMAASQYYQHEEYKKDSFAKGKELDKKLRENFAKIDEMQEKLHTAVSAWRKEHPADTSKMEEGEKLGRATLDDARDVFMLVLTKKADGEAWKAAVEKLDKGNEALKAFTASHATDAWARVMAAPIEAFIKTVKESKITADKTFDPDAASTLVANFVGIIEGRQRAVSRGANVSRPQMMPQVPATGAPAPAPAPAAPQQP